MTDSISAVVASQLLTAHVDHHSLDHVYEWQRWIWSIGPAAQVAFDVVQLRIGGGVAILYECVPAPLPGNPCISNSKAGPEFSAAASYTFAGPFRAELSAAWLIIHDQYSGNRGEYWGHSASVALGIGAGF